MATFTKLPSGKWRAQVRRQGINQGRTFARKSDAVAWASQVEQAIERGSQVGLIMPTRGMTFATAVDAYLAAVRRGKPAHTTLRAVCRVIGDVPLSSLNAFHIQRWIDHRLTEGVAGATIVHNLGTIGVLLKWLRHTRHIDIDENLARDARRSLSAARVNTSSQERDRIPTEAELDSLRTYFQSQKKLKLPMADLMNFAALSALRLGEICRIRSEDYNHNAGSVIVRDRKDPKRKVGNHMDVPLPTAAREIIERQPRNGDRIFPYSTNSVSAAWIRACDAIGIEDLHFHDLRHYAITSLFKRGLTIEQVALVSGHKTWSQLRRYTQIQATDVVDLLG